MMISDWQPWITVLGAVTQSQTLWLDTAGVCGLKVVVEFADVENSGQLTFETSDFPQAAQWTPVGAPLDAAETLVISKGMPIDFSGNLQRYLRWKTTPAAGELCFRVQVITD